MSKLIYRSDGRRSPRLYEPTFCQWLEEHPGMAALIATILVVLVLLVAPEPAHAHSWDHIGECHETLNWSSDHKKGEVLVAGKYRMARDVRRNALVKATDIEAIGAATPALVANQIVPEWLMPYLSKACGD